MRIERDQVEIIVEIAIGLGEDAPQHAGHRQNRRPHVETVAGFLENRGLAAKPRRFLEERYPMSARRQSTCGRQTAQAAANDANFRSFH